MIPQRGSFRERLGRIGSFWGTSQSRDDVFVEEVEEVAVPGRELAKSGGNCAAELGVNGFDLPHSAAENKENGSTNRAEQRLSKEAIDDFVEEVSDDEMIQGDDPQEEEEVAAEDWSSVPKVSEEDEDFPERNGQVRVWIRERGRGWIKGYVDGEGRVQNLQGQEVSVNESEVHSVSHDDFLDHMDAVELQNLHDAPVLGLITRRYEKLKIYTCVGRDVLLISVNPCTNIPAAYTKKRMRRTHAAGNSLSQFVPHVFSMADATYRGMMRDKKSQSIIISGDSGAGKTEAAKSILRYLAFENHYSRRVWNGGNQDLSASIENRVIETNPVLEAFGNAKTHLNHNSSRFGKLLQVLYDDDGVILGARIQQFLLEKSRVSVATIGQRNFHIFYQLVRGASESEKFKYKLLPLEKYRYLSENECYDAEGIDDVAEFKETKRAFSVLGFAAEEVDSILRLVSGILRLGNLQFVQTHDGDGVCISDPIEAQTVANLFKVDGKDLISALTTRTMEINNEEIRTAYQMREAEGMRDGLAKATYKNLFSYLVSRLNDLLMNIDPDAKAKQAQRGLFICLLDQAGFEIFENNSLEQLLINFSNEKMQGQFHDRISSVEKQAYADEGVDWKRGLNYDPKANLLRVEALESSPDGVLEVINEEGKLPRGSDEGLLDKLAASPFQKVEDLSIVETSRIKSESFIFNHFAGAVKYNAQGMVEKNKDFLHRDLEELLSESMCPIISALFLNSVTSSLAADGRQQSGLISSRTVWVEFKPQIEQLVEILGQTTPRYVRCIKPNDALNPNDLNPEKVLRQLKYSGVLDFISVRRNGLPVRMRFADFRDRYRIIASAVARQNPVKQLIGAVLTQEADAANGFFSVKSGASETSVKWVLGRTKVFISDGLHKWLEDKRLRTIHDAMIFCTSKVRGFKVRQEFLERKRQILQLQSLGRRLVECSHSAKLLAATIQLCSACRSFAAKSFVLRANTSHRILTTLTRKWISRRSYSRNIYAASIVSRQWRRNRSRQDVKVSRASRILQTLERRRKIRRQFLAFQKMKCRLLYGGAVRSLSEAMQRWKIKFTEKRGNGAVTCERAFRGWRERQQLLRSRHAIPAFCAVRMANARRKYKEDISLVVAAQGNWRRCQAIKESRRRCSAMRTLTSAWRGNTARMFFEFKKVGAIQLQRLARMHGVRRAADVKASETIIACYQQLLARRHYLNLQRFSTKVCAAYLTFRSVQERKDVKRSTPMRFSLEHGYRGLGIKAVVFGPAGVGKSSLINTLLNERRRAVETFDLDGNEDGENMGAGDSAFLDLDEEDDDRLVHEVTWARGPINLVDTEAVADFTSANLIAEELGDDALTSVFIFVDRINSPRTPRESLRALTQVFGRSIWQRTLFVFTNSDTKVPGLSFEKLLLRKRSLLHKSLASLRGSGGKDPSAVAVDTNSARKSGLWVDALDAIYTSLEESTAARISSVEKAAKTLQLISRTFREQGVRSLAHTTKIRIERVATLQVAARSMIESCDRKRAKRATGLLQRLTRYSAERRRQRNTLEASSSIQTLVRTSTVRHKVMKLREAVFNIQVAYRRRVKTQCREFLARATPDRFEQGPERSFIVCGPQEVGKSALSKTILNDKVSVVDDDFLEDGGDVGMDVCTYKKGPITVYDTQSLGDISTPTSLCKALQYPEEQSASTFVFVDRFDSHRLPRASLRAVTQTFGPRMWMRAMIVLTHGDLKPAGSDVDANTLAKRKARAFNAAITSITSELSDHESLCSVEVLVVDSKTGRNSTTGMQAISEVLDALERVSDARICDVEQAAVAIARSWKAKLTRRELRQTRTCQGRIVSLARRLLDRRFNQQLVAATRSLQVFGRHCLVRQRYKRAKSSQQTLARVARSFAAETVWKRSVQSVDTLLDFSRIICARKERSLLLRASPLRFKNGANSKRVGAVFFGPGGVGKSLFINNLLKKKVMVVKDSMLASLEDDLDYLSPVSMVEYDPTVNLRVYETSGISDTKSAKKVAMELTDPLEHPLTTFIFVDRFDNHRVPKDTLTAATSVFGPSVWNRAIVVLTHGDLMSTYRQKIGQEIDLVDVKTKVYNTCINDVIAESNSDIGSRGSLKIPVFIVDNTANRDNNAVVESLAKILDQLKDHAASRSYLFSFQGITSRCQGNFGGSTRTLGRDSLRKGKTVNHFTARADSPATWETDNFGGVKSRSTATPESVSRVGSTGDRVDSSHREKSRRPTRTRRKSYYDVLGVDEDASTVDVRRAYKELARRFHPDRNPENVKGALEMFREITDAYEKLVGARSEAMQFGNGTEESSGMEPELSTSTSGFPVYIRTIHKRYWTIREGYEVRGICKEHELSPLERFEIRWVSHGGFILRGHNGKIVTLGGEGERLILQNAEEAFREGKEMGKIPSYMFKVLFTEEGKFVISAANHKYVVAERGGWLRATKDNARAWENFAWRLAPTESGEEFLQNPLIVNFCGHTKKYVHVNPHENVLTCAAAHPATAESDGRLVSVAHDGSMMMADEDEDDFGFNIERSQFFAEFGDFGKVVFSVVDDQEKHYVSVENHAIELRNRRRKTADLGMRICFEDSQMMRQLEFFSDGHLPWNADLQKKASQKPSMPMPNSPAENIMPTRFAMYRQF